MVLHGNRLEDLRDLTVDFVKAHPLPPLAPELFLVQSNGMKHWLEQALADDEAGLGICAATRIELPSSYLWQAYRAVLGRDAVPEQLPFDKAALTWRLYRLLPACAAGDPRFAALSRYLGDDGDGRHRFQLAQQVADVLDGYQQYRADWLAAWERGDDHQVPPDQAWQPVLWRALRDDIGDAAASTSRASVHTAFEAAMQSLPADTSRPAGLPPRIVVFGISALPMQTVRALAELGRVCQVLMVVQNPCRYHWGHVVEDRDLLRALARHRQQPRPDLDLHAEAPALLASWGKQGRDYLHLLDEFDETESRRHLLPRAELFTDPVDVVTPPTRLARLQSVILNLEPPPSVPAEVPRDPSIQFVRAHSAQREVEVLHDRLLGWLDADPTLKARDIMVMVPDMADFVSHIQAVFGRFPKRHLRHLPFSVADTSPRELPLVQALDRLLHLPESRVSFADWLALFEVAALRRRFSLSEADVAALRGWLDEAAVRWGLDGAHRISQGMPAGLADLEQNSWASGLRRLLLGYAVPGGETPWRDVLPVAGVSGLGAQRVGALADWLDAMTETLALLRESRTPRDWMPVLTGLLDRFFAADDDADERLLHRLREALDGWLELCDAAALDEPLPLVVVREHWLAQIESTGLAQRFFGGGVQFATLMPMRSIPFRIVCLLGMNDGDYPRRTEPRDFDLMTRDRRAGDRSRREDDRYLFLEALLSARERLYVSWMGRRATDNAELPPSVVVGQLQEELARRFAPVDEAVLQPLQPFSRQYFDPANLGFVTYDADWQPADDATLRARVAGAGGAELALPESLPLIELQRFLRQPVEAFWRTRLGVRLDEPEEAVPEDEPFELDTLDEHRIGEVFIDTWLREGEVLARERAQRSGELPLGAAGEEALQRLANRAQTVLRHADPWLKAQTGREDSVTIDVTVNGLRIEGTVRGLYRSGGTLLQLQLKAGALRHTRQRRDLPRYHALVKSWVTQVCLAAAGQVVSTVACGADTTVVLPVLSRSDAQRILGGWIDAWREAWTRPLPIACKSAIDYLTPEAGNAALAEESFDGDEFHRGERDYSLYLRRSFGTYAEIEAGTARWAQSLYGDLVATAAGGDVS